MQRMQRKQGGHQRAAPERARHAPQQPEQQERIGNMQAHAHEMVPAGLEAKKLAIRHVRNPGQRVPVAGVAGGKSPNNIRPLQPALNLRVLGDVVRVVIVDEAMPRHRQKDRQGRQCQQQAQHARPPQPRPPGGVPDA